MFRFKPCENHPVLIDPAGQVAWDYLKSIHPLGDAEVFAPGSGKVPIVDTQIGRLATVICFDADFPGLVRQAGQARADILLMPAKDWQPVHVMRARCATFRAIENGLSLVRATGDGISPVVDPLGQVLATGDYFLTNQPTVAADVPTLRRSTLFLRIGDSFPLLCMTVLVVLIGIAFIKGTLPHAKSRD